MKPVTNGEDYQVFKATHINIFNSDKITQRISHENLVKKLGTFWKQNCNRVFCYQRITLWCFGTDKLR